MNNALINELKGIKDKWFCFDDENKVNKALLIDEKDLFRLSFFE